MRAVGIRQRNSAPSPQFPGKTWVEKMKLRLEGGKEEYKIKLKTNPPTSKL